MRLCPASSAACERLVKLRVTPGSPSEVVENEIWSVPKNCDSNRALDALKVLCPDVYDGNGGVAMSGVQFVSASVSGLPSTSACWMPVMGRQLLYAYLVSHATMAASATVRLSSAKRRAF